MPGREWFRSGRADISLAESAVPTLIMRGTEDRMVTFEEGRYYASQIPGAVFYAFEGIGHVPIFSASAEFCNMLRAFVRTGTVPETSKGRD